MGPRLRCDALDLCALQRGALGELKRHFRDRGWAVRPPRSLQELSLRVDHETRALTQLDRQPTIPEIAQALDCDEEHILDAQRARVAHSALSLQAPRAADLGPALEDQCGRQDDGYYRAESRALLERLMTFLPARERGVMRVRFGADMTQTEISAALGISQMQLSRILRKALDRLSEIVHQQEQLRRARRCA